MRLTSCLFLVPLLAVTAPAHAENSTAGAALFKARCQTCHSVDPAKRSPLGPNLAGLAGRKAASTDFNYSPALKKSGLTWDKATLDKFLTAPFKVVPGTRMVMAVPSDTQRADLVAYLATLKK